MIARLRSWWQQIKQHPYVTGIVVLLVLMLMLFIFLAYRFGWDWTGFNSGPSQITITSASKGNYTATVSQPSKSLWDWLNLLAALAIPLVVGFGAAWFTIRQGQVREAENKDNQHDAALQTYIDKMSELLEKHLRKSQPEEEKRIVARARTLNVLRQLNPERKGNVIQFLYESHLLSTRIIDLSYTELSEANLYRAKLVNANLFKAGLFCARLIQADLSFANLSEAYLVEADLRGAKLCYADLSRANLRGADLRGADLREAKLQGANLKATLYNQKKIRMKDPQGEEPLSLEPTCFPGGFNCKDMEPPVDCRPSDKPEVCQKVNEDQSSARDTERWIDLSFIDLCYVDLSSMKLSKPNLYQAKLIEANLSHAVLTNANLREAMLNKADLSEADLSGDDLTRANLTDADLTQANLTDADLRGADLSGANLDKTVLKGTRYNTKEILVKDSQGNILVKVLLTTWPQGFNPKAAGATENNTLSGATLSGANLSDADLSYANLSSADLSKADLSEADLSGAILFGADLSEVHHLEEVRSLDHTDLRGVKGLTKKQLEACKAKGAILDEDSTKIIRA